MKIIILSILGVVLAAFYCCDIKLEIGFQIPSKCIERNSDTKTLFQTRPKVFQPFLRKEIENVWYVIGYDEKSHQITYIHTSDLQFRTREGLRVGSEIELHRDQVTVYPDWEIHGVPNEDGWTPVVGYNHSEKRHETEFGDIIEPGDPTAGFATSDKISLKVISFSNFSRFGAHEAEPTN